MAGYVTAFLAIVYNMANAKHSEQRAVSVIFFLWLKQIFVFIDVLK